MQRCLTEHPTKLTERVVQSHDPTRKPPLASEPRLILLYGGFRLYDPVAEVYRSVAELKLWLIGGVKLVIRDARTGVDVTRSVLS